MSLFITFEGGEGSGKSTQAAALYKRLQEQAILSVLTREPGGTPLGEKIARLLKWPEGAVIVPLAELLLFNASRAELVAEVIRPSLEEGKVVICDRYTDSTIAYQSYGRGLPLEIVMRLNQTATNGLKPVLTVLADVPVEVGLARKRAERSDRFQQEVVAFHRKVRDGFLRIARGEPDRFLVIDATKSQEEIAQIVWQKVAGLLSLKNG
ncbi:MAG: dTMP kinase [Chloroflexota bacterium]